AAWLEQTRPPRRACRRSARLKSARLGQALRAATTTLPLARPAPKAAPARRRVRRPAPTAARGRVPTPTAALRRPPPAVGRARALRSAVKCPRPEAVQPPALMPVA